MGPVQQAVREHVRAGMELATPGQGKPFIVEDLDQEGLVLLLGRGQWRTRLPWEALEGVPDLLRGRGWVRTTRSFEPDDDTTTLSGYLKQYTSRETANWVAVVLEQASVLELDRERPVTARVAAGY